MKLFTPFVFQLALLLIIAVSCQSQRFTPETFSGKQLSFGNGGGFSGQVKEYTLLENGQLFSANSLTNETKELKKIDKKQTKALFAKMEALHPASINFKHPGNRYYFLKLKEGKAVHEITWGSTNHPAPEGIQELYQLVSATTSTTQSQP